jgi:hypothetical protein
LCLIHYPRNSFKQYLALVAQALSRLILPTKHRTRSYLLNNSALFYSLTPHGDLGTR